MKEFTDEQIKIMPLEDACTYIINSVYENTALIELLEDAGKIRGNGHCIRQNIAAYAEKIIKERWIGTPNKQIKQT